MADIRVRGAKAGQKEPRKPNISKDTAASISTAKLLYGMAEGEVYGLADGAKSIRLEGTPLVDDAGNPNFEGVTWDFRNGSNDQEYIKGFPDVSNETPVNVELRSSQPWIKAFNDTQISAVRVRFKWNRLSETNGENGDVTGYKIDYAIDLQTDGGVYQNVLTTKIQDKTSAGYERTHRIDLPKANTGWQLRVRRITPNSTSDLIQDTMMIDAVAEVIDVKLSYPNTALLGVQYNAELFSNIAKMSVRLKGKIIRVPDNYDPVARTYTGIWTGNFKDAYSNNPAWVFYDLCTQWRGGLGERLDATMIDRWSLYALGQYCDQPVSDGQGGLEPRFTCNVYLQKQEEAYTVLQNIAGIFRAMSFWTGERIMLDADVPQDSIYTYSSANIVGGVAGIQYSGTRNRDRHTLAKVAWDNPNNDYQTEYEYIRDEKAMSKFGVKVLDLSAFGCTSQAQAQRAGLWALKTEQLETRQVTFSVGLDGAIPRVGNIISLSDEAFAGRANGGRVSTVNSTQRIIELDREVTASVGDVLIINGGSGKSERRNISNVVGNRITVTAGFTSAEREHVWAIETADLKLMRFRVMSITENDDATYAITAIQHEPQKYDAIDFGTDVKPTEITIVNPDTVDAPASVTIASRHREVQGQTVTTLIISWSQVSGAVAYDAEWRKDDGTWVKVPRTGNVSVEIDGVYSGNYMARVRAISAFDVQSNPTTSILTEVKGKIGLPPTVVGLTATGILFGMELKWGFAAGSGDAAYTEIQVSSAPNVNVATLTQVSYPTNTHTVTGLQGNLSQSYRARLVDKLGFKSPWSAWVTGTTDASADKVLDLIEGQITESHLYQELTDKIDKVSKIEPLELLVGDETKGLVKAIADERDARITAIGTSALEGSKSLHDRADALAGTVNGITEWQEEVDTDIEKGFAKMTYLASELDFGYADKTQQASSARGTAWTFAKTVARADYVNSELARGISADLAGTKASFTEQITATATKNEATTQKIENLSAQVVGGYEGNDLGELSSGLLYQESTARASDYSALSEQISLLSAGVGEQFDPYQIWHFDKDAEGWTGGTYNDGFINARTDKLQSPSMSKTLDDGTIETLSTNAYHHIKMRLEVVGEPTWSGLVEWSGGSTTITEPVIDGGIANISFDLKWSGSIDSFTIKIAETADNLNYYKVDWIAVGRPSPGASSAAVLDIKRAFSDYKVSSSEKITDLTSTIYGNDLTPFTASIREQLKTLATDSGTYADSLSVLDAWYKGEDASMAAITRQQYEALTSADSANARSVDELFAEMDFGYADRTKFANINRSMQRTLATTIAVADWTQNQRIDTLQSEFQGNTAQIQNELLTLASKDLSIASEQTRLSAKVGENSGDILELSLAVTNPESGLAAQVTQLQATAEAAERLAGTKGEIIYSVAEPPAKDQLPQNLWFKKEGENTTPHVWDMAQSKWVALTDKAAADAQAEANAAKQAAGVAQGAAEAKGEVIFDDAAPEAAKQLPQNLWIDTSLVDGEPANTPKRWDGLAWVEVTDKATKDAASVASAAQGAAEAAQGVADDAAEAAALAQGELDAISDDDKLTPIEKKQLRIIVDDIKQVDVDIRARAAKYNVSVAEYDAKYDALVTNYINDFLADHDITSNIVRTEFNRKFNEFFAKRAQLDTSIAIAAKSVADKAQEAANNKGENIYSPSAPSVDKQLPQNIWYKIEGNVVTAHAWSNGKWTPIVDKGAADAKTAADNKGEVIYSNTAPAADKRKTQNLWVDTTNGKNVFKRWNGSAWVAVTDQTAVDIANSKGEVITSDTIPAATKRKPQNLWIDTRLGKNTPRRWNGTAWEAVTDQAAIDAIDDVKLNLATYVKESGAYSTEFGNIAGEITTIQSTVEGVTDSIEVVAAIGDAERLKYEIAKERLNKDKVALQGKVADLDSLIAKYKAQRTDAQAKKAEATNAEVIALYDAQIALLNTSITDTEAQRDEVASQVAQMEQEITELASLKLTESEVKKQYFVKFDSGNRAAGFGMMENANATIDFAVLADKFYIAPPPDNPNDVNGTSPFMVLTDEQEIDGVTVPAGTYMRNFYAPKGSIDTLQVADAAIKSAQIDNLAVTTLKIEENAVTIPDSQSFTGDISFGDTQLPFYEFGSLSMDLEGGSALINVFIGYLSVQRSSSTGAVFKLHVDVYRGAERISRFTRDFSMFQDLTIKTFDMAALPPVVHKPPAGMHTYKVRLSFERLQGDQIIGNIKEQRALTILGAKR